MALQASSKVKGITIEIGADTTSFGYALSGIKKDAATITHDLKNVDNALKLNPNNVGIAADKLKLLREQAENATKKVNTIKAAIEGLNKEYADKSSKEYTDQLGYLERQLESASREQEIANARLKDFQTNAGNAKVEVMDLGKMIEAHLVSNGVSFVLNGVKDAISGIISKIKELSKALIDFSIDSIQSAATYQDQIGYSETVFGEMSDSALDWANNNSEGLRISKQQLTTYMNTLGQVFHSQGMAEDEALEKVESLMTLAADLRAATGKTTDEILPVMQRGFTTSVKNFRQFGVIMTDAEVQAYALSHGLANLEVDETKLAKATANLHDKQEKAQKALDKYGEGSIELEKAEAALAQAEEDFAEATEGKAETMDASTIITARYLLLMERLANIQGQNERESGLFNSQLALLQTKFQNLTDEIGLKLLPVATDLITTFNDFLGSEEGKALLQQIVDQFKEWAKSISEMVEDGRFTEFIQNLLQHLPELVDTIGDIVTKVIEAAPYVAELADNVLQLFGIKTENQQIKEAFLEVESQIKSTAEKSGIDINQMIGTIHAYAEANNLDLLDIYNNWDKYEPEISKYITNIATTAESTGLTYDQQLSNMTTATTTNVETQISTVDRLQKAWADFKSFFDTNIFEVLSMLLNPTGASSLFLGSKWASAGIGNLFGRANGGPVGAGQLVRVNDDAGHRPEIFVPSVPGTILNGNQTDKIMNNYNNSRTVSGGINIYVTSNALTVDALVTELGVKVDQRLRMSGAML